mmetsp:Transcript_26849/g.47752  ORF Transcript_26849/g.47752 Transcript_26849/m.47752 type:complete len:376 (-) Transcript_26849:386-1513(-)
MDGQCLGEQHVGRLLHCKRLGHVLLAAKDGGCFPLLHDQDVALLLNLLREAVAEVNLLRLVVGHVYCLQGCCALLDLLRSEAHEHKVPGQSSLSCTLWRAIGFDDHEVGSLELGVEEVGASEQVLHDISVQLQGLLEELAGRNGLSLPSVKNCKLSHSCSLPPLLLVISREAVGRSSAGLSRGRQRLQSCLATSLKEVQLALHGSEDLCCASVMELLSDILKHLRVRVFTFCLFKLLQRDFKHGRWPSGLWSFRLLCCNHGVDFFGDSVDLFPQGNGSASFGNRALSSGELVADGNEFRVLLRGRVSDLKMDRGCRGGLHSCVGFFSLLLCSSTTSFLVRGLRLWRRRWRFGRSFLCFALGGRGNLSGSRGGLGS